MVEILEVGVLDKGSVELISNTKDGDLLVVNAARCSFDKRHEDFDKEKDTKLINYLAREQHLLPFRHPVSTLRINCPIFVLRQLGKHQVGFSWSEVSRRYITSKPEFYEPHEWRQSADNVKQGSSKEAHPQSALFKEGNKVFNEDALVYYNHLLGEGVCPEQARIVLPQSMYTTAVTTGTLLGWHHLYTQRTEKHTQLETQEYAMEIGNIMKDIFPVSWRALCEHSS